MIHPQIYALPTVQKALTIADSTIAFAQRIHQAVTSDRAHRVYHSIIKVTINAMLLTIAAGMLTRQAVEALRQWVNAHKDEDLNKLAQDKALAVAATVKRFVKGQRDRASLLTQATAADLEMRARAKVSRLGLMISDRALAQCGVEGCTK